MAAPAPPADPTVPKKVKAAATRAPSASWTAEEEKFLVDCLLEHKTQGNQAEAGWKPQVWTDIETRLADRGPPSAGAVKTAAHIKSKFNNVSSSTFYLLLKADNFIPVL
jgi:hypothetical protein